MIGIKIENLTNLCWADWPERNHLDPPRAQSQVHGGATCGGKGVKNNKIQKQLLVAKKIVYSIDTMLSS